ncbi:MAG: hypothetical protein JXM69_20915 [Anaerolineae bacterium]|nr:hypothetical protein [Anaerolineae bacterium]
MKPFKILLPLLLLAFFLRVWQLPQIPPGLWYDEAYYSMDATYLLDGGPWQLFFAGNNGREPIFIYWQALLIWIFGATPLTSRLIAPWVGTLSVPLIYALARRLARRTNWSYGVPYLATAGIAVSFWHIGLSRGGFRGILLPLMAMLVFYTFWRGWRENSARFMVLAGVALGVSQYTYLAARILPAAIGLFAVVWTVLHWRDRAEIKVLWLTVLITALLSAAIFAPLGWIFYHNPKLFSSRTEDVVFTPNNLSELATHLSDAIRLFIDGGDPNWRHHLPGRPMLGWLGWLGFWPGMLICFRRLRRTPYLFLLIILLTLYLPALFSVPPAHALRLSAMLPFYYIIFVLGLTEVARWISGHWLCSREPLARPVLAAVIVIMVLESGLTGYDYFYRWAKAEDTYVEYNTPLVDFVNHLINQTEDSPVIMPFQLYVHPTTRYLLHDQFTEQPVPASLAGPARLITLPNNYRILNVANIPELPSFVWLARNEEGRGVVYVSRPPQENEQAFLKQVTANVMPEIYSDRFGCPLAELRNLANPSLLGPMFTETAPERTIYLNWGNLAELRGYDVVPDLVEPNRPITFNLYWRSLTDKTFEYRLFLQLIDGAGNPINQWEGDAFNEDMYRWRPNGILPTQHTLWLGPNAPPGPYLVRLGFFDELTGQRLPLVIDGQVSDVDQVQLGLFYVATDGTDPRQPGTSLAANFAGAVRLIGITAPPYASLPTPYTALPITLHWQTLHPTDKPYTIFLQLLDQQGEVVSGWDQQPFGGLYPTNLWSPGEVIADTIQLPLPEAGLPPGDYRLITGFYDFETGQRLPVRGGGDFTELGEFVVE